MKKTLWKNVWQTVCAVAVLVGVWVIVWASVGNEQLVPSFWQSLKAFFLQFSLKAFWQGIASTALRVLGAFVISFVLAAGLAIVAYLLPTFKRIFAPIIAVFRAMPVFAVLVLLLVWSGEGSAPILVACLSLFPSLYTGLLSSLCGVDEELLEMSALYEVPTKRKVWALYVPHILPYAIRESGAAIGFALKLVVSAEVLVRTAKSFGILMYEAQTSFDLPQLFALTITVCALGFLAECAGERLARSVERRRK